MPEIRVHVKFHEGREGAPLDKLSQITEKWDLFLRSLASDVGLSIGKGEWIGVNFASGSVAFDIIHAGDYRDKEVRSFKKGLREVSSFDPSKGKRPNGRYSGKTLLRYAQIGEPLSLGERISIGIYEEPEKLTECPPLSKRLSIELLSELDKSLDYYGTIYGTIHALYKGPKPMYFQLREYLSDALVPCEFKEELYGDVIKALERPLAIVYVSGLITANKVSREIKRIETQEIKPAPTLSQEEYEKFFGFAPEISGSLTTEEYIDITRSPDEEDE